MSYMISKEFTFDASHVLHGLPEGHKCGRHHGHTYRVIVEITGNIDDVGFVIDYGELAPVKRWIDEHLDHYHLNDVEWFPPGFNPTAEHLAYELSTLLVTVVPRLGEMRDDGAVRWRVGVSETPKTWAWCDLWQAWPPPPDPMFRAIGAPLDAAAANVTAQEMARYFGVPVGEDAPAVTGDTSRTNNHNLNVGTGFSGVTSVQLQSPPRD